MPIVVGTRKGVYQISDPSLRRIERVLDEGRVYSLERYQGTQYAATDLGLYRSTDDNQTWTELEVPGDEVNAVAVSPDGTHVYAGVMPAELYVSTDGGDTWEERESFQEIPSREKWFQQGSKDTHVRSFAVHPDVPDRLLVGVDGGGVHLSEDRGKTWETRTTGITQYIHYLLPLGPDEYLAATDAGLYWTDDCGEWWDFLDDNMRQRYFKSAFEADGGDTVYAGGARAQPSIQRADGTPKAGFYELDFGSDQRRIPIEQVRYPDEPDDAVLTGTEHEGHLFAGTTNGKLLRRTEDDAWEVALTLPGQTQIRHLESY